MPIKYCPNCKSDLKDNKQLAQNIKECAACGGRYFTIETSQPKKHNIIINQASHGDLYYANLCRAYKKGKN